MLNLPVAGGTLVHVATIPIAAHGQAIAWDGEGERILWGIDRDARQLVQMRIPAIPKP